MSEMDPKPVEPIVAEPAVVETAVDVTTDEVVTIEAAEPASWNIPSGRRRTVYAGMWGPVEIAVVSAAALVLIVAGIIYFFWVIPSNRELARNKAEAGRLEAELISASSKYGDITSSETQVAKLNASVSDFEMNHLPVASTGQSALYQRLNGLIGAYGLINTSGPDYVPLETLDMNTTRGAEEDKGRSRFRSLYPGVYVTTTVEGSYQNVRRFIREIETGREFIVVSAVELAPSDSEGQKPVRPATGQGAGNPVAGMPKAGPGGIDPMAAPAQAQLARPKGKTHGEIVSLRIELAAYFRRPNTVPVTLDQ